MAVEGLTAAMTDLQMNGSLIPNKVFVGGLSEKTVEKDLREIFQTYAPVGEVKIIVDHSVKSKSGDPRRYAFIAFDDADEAKKVLSALSDKPLDLHGRRLTVGQAYRKPTPNGNIARLMGPSVVPAATIFDPFGVYRAAMQNWNFCQKQPMSPTPMGSLGGGYYQSSPYAGYYDPSYMVPMSPTMMSPYGSMSSPQSPMPNGMVPNGHMSSSPMGYPMKNIMSPVSSGMDNGYSGMGNVSGMEDGSPNGDAYMYKSPMAGAPLDSRTRNTNNRMMGSMPTHQPAQYIHQGPISSSPMSSDARYNMANPGIRGYVQKC